MNSNDIFRIVAYGLNLPSANWRALRNERGQTLLHTAAQYGRNDAAWKLLHTFPHLAAEADWDLQLPEHVASTWYTRRECKRVRQLYLLQYEAL